MKVNLKKVGTHCLILQWEETIPQQMQAVQTYIKDKFDKDVLEMVPTYRELALYLHFESDIYALKESLEANLPKIEVNRSQEDGQVFQIPVCYSPKYGMDLKPLAKAKELSVAELIERHTAPTYQIHFLGFLPGFPYLSGLDEKLQHSRLESPRQKIPAGSVGIAGTQTGIYPHSSPGGWNLIGRTPLKLFDIEQSPPALLKPMQKLKFYAISEKEFEEKEKELKR
ncbi:MAG: 5-oxoprolinase subunit PxpB [Vicingaceae bacterium]